MGMSSDASVVLMCGPRIGRLAACEQFWQVEDRITREEGARE